jgi:glutamate dehydrogenase
MMTAVSGRFGRGCDRCAGVAIDRLLHPVVAGRARCGAGAITALGKPQGGRRESLIYIETPRVDARQRRELLEALETTLADVHAAVSDWPRCRRRWPPMPRWPERWIPKRRAARLAGGGMLTQLGHLTRSRDGTTRRRLGICRASAQELLADVLRARLRWFDARGRGTPGRCWRSSPTSMRASTAPARSICSSCRVRDGKGAVTALSIHAGLWTSAALNARPHEVPVLRAMVSGHDAKARLRSRGAQRQGAGARLYLAAQ